MSNVLGLHTPDFQPSLSPAFVRMRRASRLFASLFTGLFWASGAVVAAIGLAMLIYTGPHLQVSGHGFEITELDRPLNGFVVFGTLPLITRLAHVLMAPIAAGPVLMIFWNLSALFRLYGQGVVFARENGRHIQKIGLWLIAAAFAPIVTVTILSVTGQAVDHAWFHMQQVQELILGGLVYVIAQVMQVGREIEEDRSQFI
jgi:hypothetical protein